MMLTNEQWNEMIMIYTIILRWYLWCDDNDIYTMRIQWGYNNIYRWDIFTMRHWYYMKWNEKWWLNIYIRWILNFYPLFTPSVTKKILIMSLLVMSEDVQIEEGFAAEQAHQPHSQMHFPKMGANSCPWGWWALLAALNLALINLLGAPQLNSEGLHVGWYVFPQCWSGRWKSRCSGQAYRIWDIRSCGFLRGLRGNRRRRAQAGLWHRWLGGGKAGAWGDSLRSPYKPSISDPTMASLSFPHPSVSNCWASISNFLASSLFSLVWESSLKPYKEGGKKPVKI